MNTEDLAFLERLAERATIAIEKIAESAEQTRVEVKRIRIELEASAKEYIGRAGGGL